MKVEGVTPAARKQFRIDERKRLQSLEAEEEELAMQGLGKLLVSRLKELFTAKPEPRGVAGASEVPRTIGRGRARRREKMEVNVAMTLACLSLTLTMKVKPEVLPSPEAKPAPRGVAGVSEAPRMAGRGRIKVSARTARLCYVYFNLYLFQWLSRFN